jgi:hypothetical protein
MNSVMLFVKEKTVYLHMEGILKKGDIVITNISGNIVFQEKLTNSHYEVISLDQPEGKYWISIETEKKKTKKSFHLK